MAEHVAYYRVSTQAQGRSGLGLEAQRAAVLQYLRGALPLAEYTEIESGKVNSRPELARAMQHCRLTGATLVIAKLDRLSRNAAFLLSLRDSGIAFIAADMPDANALTVGILALIAQHEREQISARTKAALAAARARGARLGNPNGTAAIRRAGKGNAAALAARRSRLIRRARELAALVAETRHLGVSGMADEFNRRGIRTPRGGQWHRTSIKRLLKTLDALPAIGQNDKEMP